MCFLGPYTYDIGVGSQNSGGGVRTMNTVECSRCTHTSAALKKQTLGYHEAVKRDTRQRPIMRPFPNGCPRVDQRVRVLSTDSSDMTSPLQSGRLTLAYSGPIEKYVGGLETVVDGLLANRMAYLCTSM